MIANEWSSAILAQTGATADELDAIVWEWQPRRGAVGDLWHSFRVQRRYVERGEAAAKTLSNRLARGRCNVEKTSAALRHRERIIERDRVELILTARSLGDAIKAVRGAT